MSIEHADINKQIPLAQLLDELAAEESTLRKDAERYRAIRENLREFLEHIQTCADPDVVDIIADDLIAFNRPHA